jgi:hypothetical protein
MHGQDNMYTHKITFIICRNGDENAVRTKLITESIQLLHALFATSAVSSKPLHDVVTDFKITP